MSGWLAHDLLLQGRRIVLSQKEFALLRTLATEPTRVFTKANTPASRGLALPELLIRS
jgi:DNA-binding response OmpR family regulator